MGRNFTLPHTGEDSQALDWFLVRVQRQVADWLYESGGWFRWSITDRSGRPLADSADWYEGETLARQHVLLTLRELLRSDLVGVNLEVARHLAELSAEARLAVIENANEIRFEMLRIPD